jgi:organic hydroperoxide reductase OsmC/OhrA
MDNSGTPSKMLQHVSEFQIQIEQVSGFEFRVRFDKEQYRDLTMDEPAPLGKDAAPNPSRILAAAIGDCLSASLLFCAQKARVEIGPVRTNVRVQLGRNEKGRLRIAKVDVEIDPNLSSAEKERALRCLEIFEDFCVVTQSVRDGIDVNVTVKGLEARQSPEN